MATTGLDLDSILQSSAELIQGIAAGTSSLQKNYTTGQNIQDTSAELYKTIGANDQIIDQTKQTGEFATQQARLKVANKLGTDARASTEIYSKLADTIATEFDTRQAAFEKIREKVSVDFFDDPIQWISNRLTIDQDIKEHNLANMNLRTAQEHMQQLNQLTQSTTITQNGLNESITAASIKASSDNLAAQAQLKANAASLQGLVYNADAIKAALTADKDINSVKFSVFGAQKQEEQARMALAHLDLQRQEFDWKKQEKLKAEGAESLIIDAINRGAQQRLGAQATMIQPGSIEATKIVSLFKSNTPAGEQLQTDYKIGSRSGSFGFRSLATSPADATDLLFGSNLPVSLSPAQQPVKELLKSSVDKIVAATKNPESKITLQDLKNPEVRASLINSAVNDELKRQASLIKPGDSENVFNIGSVSNVIANSPTLKQLPVVQKVLAPAIATGRDLSDPNTVFSLVAKAVQDKTITSAQAMEMTSVYQVGVEANAAARQFTSFGMVPIKSYNVKLTTNPVATFGATNTVDVTKTDSVGRALNKYLSALILPDVWKVRE